MESPHRAHHALHALHDRARAQRAGHVPCSFWVVEWKCNELQSVGPNNLQGPRVAMMASGRDALCCIILIKHTSDITRTTRAQPWSSRCSSLASLKSSAHSDARSCFHEGRVCSKTSEVPGGVDSLREGAGSTTKMRRVPLRCSFCSSELLNFSAPRHPHVRSERPQRKISGYLYLHLCDSGKPWPCGKPWQALASPGKPWR